MIEIEMKWIGEKPRWVKVVYISDKPTSLDSEGCEGFYIKKIYPKWWGWPILLINHFLRKWHRSLQS
jgi:hypothetical protein